MPSPLPGSVRSMERVKVPILPQRQEKSQKPSQNNSCQGALPFLLGWAFRDLWLRPKEKHSGRQAWSWVEERTDWGWQRGWGAWELRRDLGRVQDHQESRQRAGWEVHSFLGRRMGQTGSQVAEAGWLSYLSWRNWTGGWARRPQWWPRHEATWWEGKERKNMRARGSKNG